MTLTGDGSVVYLWPTGTLYPSLYSSDAYNRAANIYLAGSIPAEVVRRIQELKHLRAFGISVLSRRNDELPPGFDELLFAAIDFHEQHPDVALSLTCSNWSGETLFKYP